MTSILKKLYEGEISPTSDILVNDQRAKAIDKKIDKKLKYFEGILSEEAYNELDKLGGLYLELTNLQGSASFSQGFRLCAKLIVEIFTENDSQSVEKILKKLSGKDDS